VMDVLSLVLSGKLYHCQNCGKDFTFLSDHDWAKCAIESGHWHVVDGASE